MKYLPYVRVFVKGQLQFLPHGGAVEVNHQPLGRVESEAVGKLDAGHPSPELRADEGRAGVSSVNVKPHLLFLA